MKSSFGVEKKEKKKGRRRFRRLRSKPKNRIGENQLREELYNLQRVM